MLTESILISIAMLLLSIWLCYRALTITGRSMTTSRHTSNAQPHAPKRTATIDKEKLTT